MKAICFPTLSNSFLFLAFTAVEDPGTVLIDQVYCKANNWCLLESLDLEMSLYLPLFDL